MPHITFNPSEFENSMMMRAMELRQRELASRSFRSPRVSSGIDMLPISEVASRVETFNLALRKMSKMRKPPRTKKLKATIHCYNCRHSLDPNGKIHRFHGDPCCRKCWNKKFFRCPVCNGIYHRNPGPCICQTCLGRIARGTGPRPTSDISWRKGSNIEGSTSDAVGSKRAFGVEFETQACPWAERLEGKTPFGCKYDSTVEGREFDSPILSGDDGLAAVTDFCDLAKSRGWVVNDQCGTHVHLDMRNESDQNLKKVAIAYLRTFPVWASLVKPHRLINSYCGGLRYTVAEVLNGHNFTDIGYNTSRYQFINLAAYGRHNTIEVRGLEGSLEKSLVTNWIKAHLRFVDYVMSRELSDIERQFNVPDSIMWGNVKKCIGQGPARFWGRVRAERLRKLALS